MKLYIDYLKLHFKSILEYKLSFILSCIAQIFVFFGYYFIILSLFDKFSIVKGFTLYEVLLTFSVIQFGYSFNEAFARGVDQFDHLIIDGSFDRLLLRPQNILSQVIGYKIDYVKLSRVAQSIIIMIYSLYKLNIVWTPLKLLTLVFMNISSIIIFFSVFLLSASYSFINGKWGNIGAALGFAPYDGLMLTLATDYVPLTYAKASINDKTFSIPYKTPGVNLSFGIAIVAGTNKKKAKDNDKDGILDYFDLCPNPPANVRVDDMGCPFDSDGDGIADYMDECPNTPSASYGLIDSVGCPIDSDTDGIADYLDRCSNTPAEAIGFLNENGCPLDTDGDGVYDYIDQCPGTPAAAYGMVDSVGCPIDTDGDSVPDYLDLCPETPAEAYGFVDQNGCPIDTDKDGVFDYCDSCQNTIPEGRNYVDAKGCLLDTDKDGVYDYEDLCPTVAGVKANKGCPEVKREVRNLLKKAMSGIQFENGKATIKKNSYKILNDIAKIFIDNTNYLIEVQGHTDNVGKYDYNVDLSERRAQSVRTYLIKQGVPAERLTAHGYGPDKPIADNKTKAGRAQNRRVEFNITFEEVTYETIYDRVQNTDSTTNVQKNDSTTTK